MNARLRRLLRTLIGPASYDEVGLALRFIGRQPQTGWVLDVGANNGDSSRPFAERGWKVLAIEPDPHHRRALENTAAQFPSFVVDYRAVAVEDGKELTLFRSPVSAGISTLSAFHPSHTAGPVVTTVRLDTLLNDRGIDNVAFLKTDTEGYDLFALRSFPWGRTLPAIVVSEFENRKSRKLGYSLDTMARYLESHGYVVLVSEWHPIVEYGTVHRWKAIRKYPSAEIDDAGWGNLVAVQPQHAGTVHRLAHRAARQLRFRLVLERIRAFMIPD